MIYFSFRFSCLTFEKLRQPDMQLALRGPSPGVQEIPRPFRFPPLKITLTECVVLLGREDESKRNHLGAPSPSSPHSVGRGGPVLTVRFPPHWLGSWGGGRSSFCRCGAQRCRVSARHTADAWEVFLEGRMTRVWSYHYVSHPDGHGALKEGPRVSASRARVLSSLGRSGPVFSGSHR